MLPPLGDRSSQVDRPPGGPGPRSCVGTRLATTIGAPLFVSRGEELCGMSAGSGQPPPVVGIAQIWRSACTGGRLCRVRLPLPCGGEARGLVRRSCASRPNRLSQTPQVADVGLSHRGEHNCDATGETVGLLARAIASLRRRARVARLLRTGRESPGYRVPARKDAFEATRSAPLVPVHFGGLV
jgi:hypothetical protein